MKSSPTTGIMLRFVMSSFVNFVSNHRRSLIMFSCIVTFAIVCHFALVQGVRSLPLVLGHRGACGVYPEHTSISYEKGAEMGADYIECDVQITKDLQLVCSHESWINEVCNVEDHTEFSNRIRSYNFDDDDPNFDWNDNGIIKDNYFTVDFTLEELKTLKRKQHYPTRDPNYNWKYSFVSFDEFVNIAKSHDVGISMELKSPTALNKILKDRNHETTAQKMVIDSLKKHGYTGPNDKCLLQSFELSILEEIKDQTEVNRVFLLKRLAKTDEETLKRAQNANVFSVCLDKELLISTSDLGYIENINQDLCDQIHDFGMQVYAYTFKNDEISKLKWDYHGDPRNELQKFYELGLEAYFTDYPGTARSFVDSILSTSSSINFSSKFLAVITIISIWVSHFL